jgi:hypothetical protein
MTERGGLLAGQAVRLGARLGLAGALLAGAGAASAAIYSCVDANGKKLTSDRPIAECATREQRVLNPDGSVRSILPPTLTADERAEQEARERQRAAERAQLQDAIRRDRNLMVRFPNEAAHNKARNASLDDVRAALQRSERRLADLALERKPLHDEAEFYVNRSLPPKLRQQLESNDTAAEALRVLIQNQQAEIVRVNALYDTELERLRRLWAGAPPGSMGAITPAPAPAASVAAAKKTAVK